VAAEGLVLCSEIIAQVRTIPGVAGVHVMAFGWEDAIPEILERAGLGPRSSPGDHVARSVAVPFDDDDEGIAIANGTDFALYDYVFSGDTNRAFRASKRMRAGNVGINTTQRNHNAPFGGNKMSGVGRDGGDFGLLDGPPVPDDNTSGPLRRLADDRPEACDERDLHRDSFTATGLPPKPV